MENGERKWCSYHQTDGHSNKDCYQQPSESVNLDSKKRWCTYHNSTSHSNNECFHQRVSKFENSSSVDGKNSGNQQNFTVDCAPIGWDAKFCCKYKEENNYNEKATTSRIPYYLALGSRLRRVISPYFNKLTAFNSWWIQDRQSVSLIQS